MFLASGKGLFCPGPAGLFVKQAKGKGYVFGNLPQGCCLCLRDNPGSAAYRLITPTTSPCRLNGNAAEER